MAKTDKQDTPKLKIKRGDVVQVISGNDRGARGRVLRVLPAKQAVVVEGVNIRKKHQRQMQAGRGQTQGGIIQFEAPIHISNVMLVDPATDKPTRIGVRRVDGKRVRFAKKSGQDIE